MLFDLFYLNAWMKEGMLVWQPEWVNSIIAWVKNHTNTPPLNIDRDLFTLKISGTAFQKFFANEQEFMNAPLMDTFFSSFGILSAMASFYFAGVSYYGVFWIMAAWNALTRGISKAMASFSW